MQKLLTTDVDATSGVQTGVGKTSGDTARHYDSSGRYTGRTERSGDTLRQYDSSGRLLGTTRR